MKKRIISMVLMLGMIFSMVLPGLGVSAEESVSSYDEQIKKAEEIKAKAQKRADELRKDIEALEKDSLTPDSTLLVKGKRKYCQKC